MPQQNIFPLLLCFPTPTDRENKLAIVDLFTTETLHQHNILILRDDVRHVCLTLSEFAGLKALCFNYQPLKEAGCEKAPGKRSFSALKRPQNRILTHALVAGKIDWREVGDARLFKAMT
ncbi:hypothetical protein CEXT_336501 [Caerostris extrusa]|uniref:Uncharacterized protein n=1 Tax=Caerostris extrusa TaxID=172846 RepID=A0AAV4XF19_CAEEX|nr:hypothetical protein CEXT_336501 [Caerostris extrusa]